MRVAVTSWAGRVSPVCDVAKCLVLLEVEQGREVARSEQNLDASDFSRRAKRIAGIGVDILICGAISYPLEGMLNKSGIRVIPWICGDVEDVLEAFLCGRLSGSAFLMPGCCGRRRRFHGRQGRRGQFSRKGTIL